MTFLSINEIYRATEGEGVNLGHPQIFVRFQGCNVGCVNCDSMDTWEFKSPNMSLTEVLAKIESLRGDHQRKINRVSITGGDPLHPKNTEAVIALARELKAKKFYVNIEAAGTRIVHELFDILDFISFDYKTPSTGVKTSLTTLEKFLTQYPNKSQIKSVISDKKDFEDTYNALTMMEEKLDRRIENWVMTPCFEPGEKFPIERMKMIIDLNENFGGAFRVITQQHKYIHGPDSTNV
jgi:7-carboxy-7-deazaguanine synthase